MYARHMVLVNWGTIPTGTYDLADITAITGQTGAGKSTQLDALVTLMSAGLAQIGRLNMASEDGAVHRTKRKSYRRAEEYVVGMAKDGLCRSPQGANGYVAVAFQPDDDEDAVPFTAVIGIAAKFIEGEPTAVGVCFALVIGHHLDHKVFAPEDKGQRRVVQVSDCLDMLREQYGIRKGQKKTGVLGFKDEPKKFLRQLWGLFRGREELSQEETDRAARAWCRFVPQEGIEDVSHFVRTLIMPDPRGNLDFQGIRKLIRTNQELSRRAKALQNQKAILTEALAACRAHTSHYMLRRHLVHQGLEAQREEREKERSALVNQNVESRSLIQVKESQCSEKTRAADGAQAQVIYLSNQLDGKKGYKEHQKLKDELGEADLGLKSERIKAQAVIAKLETVGQYVRFLELAADAKPLGELATTLKESLAKTGLSSRIRPADLGYVKGLPESPSENEWAALSSAAEAIETAFFRARTALAGEGQLLFARHVAASERLQNMKKAVEDQLVQARAELSELERRGRMQPPDWAADTKAYIEKHLPQANPVFLYELVKDVKTPEWQLPIEGEINLARFNILVDQKFEPAVDNLLRSRKARRSASLIQGSLSLRQAQGKVLSDTSIASELVVENPVARAYLLVQYGHVPKLKDGTDTTSVRRGLRQDGRAAGAFTTYNADERTDGKLYFGTRAIELRKKELGDLIPKLAEAVEMTKNAEELLKRVKAADEALRALGDDTVQGIAARALALHGDIRAKQAELAMLDVSDFEELAAERDRVKGERGKLLQEAEALRAEVEMERRELDRRLERIGVIDGGADELDRLLVDAKNERARLSIAASWVSGTWLDEEAAKRMQTGKPRQELIDNLRQPLAASVNKMGQVVLRYNEAAGVEAPMSASEFTAVDPTADEAFSVMVEKYRDIDRRIQSIAADQLSSSSAELAIHESVMRQRFTEYFCDKLLLELADAGKVLNQLNADLRSHVFGSERYEFEASHASPQMALRREFFEYVRGEVRKDDRFNPFAIDLTPEMGAVRDEIIRLLASDDERDQRQLELISDYRNYHVYEMYKVFQHPGEDRPRRIAMSTNGKESGGEKENGILIARAATISSALGLRQKGPHLRFVAIDEMMKKTDEARIRESVDFLAGTRLNLQVLFVMPTRAIGPFKDLADLEYNVSRVNTARAEGTLRDKVVVLPFKYDRARVRAMREKKQAEIREAVKRSFEKSKAMAGQGATDTDSAVVA